MKTGLSLFFYVKKEVLKRKKSLSEFSLQMVYFEQFLSSPQGTKKSYLKDRKIRHIYNSKSEKFLLKKEELVY
ncbi:MAG: hypothetical protein DLD55_04820 [candidate division SR1 bacterium]|nr:MAG: hypothetical protein DLD55_04820 [candidate division SR1 bacterium]